MNSNGWWRNLLLLCLLAGTAEGSWRERVPEWDAGVRGGIPEVPVVREIGPAALRAGGSELIQAAIAEVEDRGAVLLPAGDYILKAPLHLAPGVVLRGRGMGRTTLIFDIPPPEEDGESVRPAYGAVRFAGKREKREIPIKGGHRKGSTSLVMEKEHWLAEGDLILVFSENDPELMYTEERWDASWALQSIAQIVAVTAVDGERIELDVPLRLDYRADLDPRIRRIEPLENAGLESMTIRGAVGFNDTLVGVEASLNCWVKEVETVFTGRGHIWVNFSRYITVSGNECHRAYDYGGGGNGYGIVAGNVATDCLYENNLLHHLRHAIMAKRGSSGNVFAYNYATRTLRWPESKGPIADVSIHGHYSYQNLFEGNVVQFVESADFWGPTGPLTTFFRNRVALFLQIQDHSHYTNLIGNELEQGKIEIHPSVEHTLMVGNLEEGTRPGDVEADLPASLYYAERPAFWPDTLPWPSIGPGTDPEQDLVIPAQLRREKQTRR